MSWRERSLIAALAWVLSGAAIVVLTQLGGVASAPVAAAVQTPGPSSTPPPIARINANLTDDRISWPTIPGAESISIAGRITAVAVNASNVCGPVSQPQRQQVTLDEELPGSATVFALPLPALPSGEKWLVTYDTLEIIARDGNGAPVAAINTARIVEGCMVAATSTPVRVDGLPGTGLGAARSIEPTPQVVGLAAAALGLTLGFIIIRRTRQSS